MIGVGLLVGLLIGVGHLNGVGTGYIGRSVCGIGLLIGVGLLVIYTL